MKEIFKEVPEYPGYFVSNLGRVKSQKFLQNSKVSEKFLAIDKEKITVRLRKENSSKTFKVANLVAEVFLGDKRDKRRRVKHKDGDPNNNNVKNLVWTGITASDVTEIRKMVDEGYTIGEISRKFDVNKTHIRRIRDNKVWKHVD